MATETIRVSGYRECLRALRKVDKDLSKTIRGELRDLAEPIAAEARSNEARWRGASTQTIKPRAVQSGVFITQRAKKVTGLRPDYGALQMRDAMIPAVEEHADSIKTGLEHVLDRLISSNGF